MSDIDDVLNEATEQTEAVNLLTAKVVTELAKVPNTVRGVVSGLSTNDIKAPSGISLATEIDFITKRTLDTEGKVYDTAIEVSRVESKRLINDRDIVDLKINQQTGVMVYATKLLLDAYTPTVEEEKGSFKVTNDPDIMLNGYYTYVSGTYVKDVTLVSDVVLANNISDAVSGKAVSEFVGDTIISVDRLLSKPSKNLIDNSKLRSGFRVSPDGNGIKVDTNSECTEFIPVIHGVNYWFSGIYTAYWMTAATDKDSYLSHLPNGSVAPPEATHIVCTTYYSYADLPEVRGVAMLTYGDTPPDSYTPYRKTVSQEDVFDLEQSLTSKVSNDKLFSSATVNLLNKELVENTYYSPSSNALVNSASYRSVRCDVIGGTEYIISGVRNQINAWTTDIDGTDIIGTFSTSTDPITAPPTAKYLFIVIDADLTEGEYSPYLDTAMLRLSTAPAQYASYGDKIPQSLVESGLDKLKASEYTERVSSGNMIDVTSVDYDKRYSENNHTLVNDNLGIAVTDFIEVIPGNTYALSGEGIYSGRQGGFYDGVKQSLRIALSPYVVNNVFTVPTDMNITYLKLSLAKVNNDPEATELAGDAYLHQGQVPNDILEYTPPQTVLRPDKLPIEYQRLLEYRSFNLINPNKIDYTRRYSVASKQVISDNIGIASTERIPVIEGQYYTLSGGYYSQGGYFGGLSDTTAIADIVMFTPVDGIGKNFQVPLGLGINYIVVSLSKKDSDYRATELTTPAQLELGEVATDFRPYRLIPKVAETLLPEVMSGSVTFNPRVWLTHTDGDCGSYLTSKLPKFRRSYLLRDRDLCVINSGTSLTARSVEHSTAHPDASTRPPLMHSNNYASIIWDKLKWENQYYRRYDVSGVFVEGPGDWITSTSVGEAGDWDDDGYRNGLTRHLSGGEATLSYNIPAKMWQCNFIYRSDTLSGTTRLTISGGDGKVVCLNSVGVWVEANGYLLDMSEAQRVNRTISVPNPESSDNTPRDIVIPSKGNTTYQKRLKMKRVDDRSAELTVTLNQLSGSRFCYWGIEYSEREHMLTFINAARGSHSTNVKTATSKALPLFADNEVWDFKPDLILSENPMHNDGAANANAQAAKYHERITHNFITNLDYELSMYSRAAHYGLTPEYVFFTSSITWNFGGISEDGTLKMAEQWDGSVISALDKYNQAHYFLVDNYPEIVSINAAKRWVDAGIAIFGNLKDATEGSGKSGVTFTNEGSHWNDTGSKIIAKIVSGVIDFTRG